MLPRRDLLLAAVRLDLPPVTSAELKAFKRFIWCLAVPNFALLLIGFWLVGDNHGSFMRMLGLILALCSIFICITLIRSAENYDPITEAQAETLARMTRESLLTPKALSFIEAVERGGRVLSSGEACALIKLGKEGRVARNMKAISEAAHGVQRQ
jgi:hypothetical protein